MNVKLTSISICIVGLALIFLATCSTISPGEKGRAQLWGQTCSRCHFAMSPSSFSDSEWRLVVHHMRVRAYLTAEEQRAIAEFLEAGN